MVVFLLITPKPNQTPDIQTMSDSWDLLPSVSVTFCDQVTVCGDSPSSQTLANHSRPAGRLREAEMRLLRQAKKWPRSGEELAAAKPAEWRGTQYPRPSEARGHPSTQQPFTSSGGQPSAQVEALSLPRPTGA